MGLLDSFKVFKHLENNIAAHGTGQMDHLQKVVIDSRKPRQ